MLFEKLDIELRAGEMLLVSGPNGAGKTSLLRLLAGLSPSATGALYWRRKPIQEDPVSYHRELIFVGHKLGLNGHLTALENIQFWLRSRTIDIAEHQIIAVLDMLALLGMEDVLVGRMSAGQQRRVALAKLWLAPAKLWILDEPLTALDKTGVVLLETKMVEHLRCGGILIATSHQALNRELKFRELMLEEQPQ